MKNKQKIIIGLVALTLFSGALVNKFRRSGEEGIIPSSSSEEEVVQKNENPKLEDIVIGEGEITRTNVTSIGDPITKYSISERDPQFRTNVLAGVRKYLKPISEVNYNGATIRVPIDLDFKSGSVSNITLAVNEKETWKFSVEGHSVMYHKDKDGEFGYLKHFGPVKEENVDLLIQSTNVASLEKLGKKPLDKRLKFGVADGLLVYALNSIPRNSREYFDVSIAPPLAWNIYNFDVYSAVMIENSPQYRANNGLNPSCDISIMGESPKQAKLLSFELFLSDTNRFAKVRGPGE